MQEVYLAVWQRAASFDQARASPITWLAAIARNRAIDRVRSGGRSRRSEPIETAGSISDPAPLASDLVEFNQEKGRLNRCLDELEARTSAAIKSAFIEGFTYEELAERYGIGRTSVAKLLWPWRERQSRDEVA